MKLKFKINLSAIEGCIERRNWIFTVLIFFTVLIGAIFVWKDCILNPQPSRIALDNILKIEKDYQNKMEEIEKNNKKLESRIEKFNNPVDNLEDRDYFLKQGGSDYEKSISNSNTNNYNPKLVN